MRCSRIKESRFSALLGVVLCGLLWIQGAANAAEIQVPEKYESIQEAIDVALPGDIISIDGGVYYENLDLKGKSIVLKSRSASNPAVLDGGGESGSLLQCISGEGSTTRVDGLTFRQGLGDNTLYGDTALVGGGVLIRDSSPTLNACRFELNFVTYNGGGIYARNSNSQIINCQFIDNNAEKGAAIYATGSRMEIRQCLFEQNNARFGGGAVFSDNRSLVRIDRCRFIENRASFNGGAIYDYDSSTIVMNSIFLNNIGAFKGGAAYHGWRSRGRMGVGNDFRTPNDDVDGSGRTINESNPLGACFIGESCVMAQKKACEDGEGVWAGPDTTCDESEPGQALPRRARGDLNRDGVVDVRDMAILMSSWGSRANRLP